MLYASKKHDLRRIPSPIHVGKHILFFWDAIPRPCQTYDKDGEFLLQFYNVMMCKFISQNPNFADSQDFVFLADLTPNPSS